MTPEEIKHWKHICQKNRDAGCETFRADVNVVEELCDSALRLSAIKAAGDEDIESLRDSFYKLLPLNTLEARRCGAFDAACEILMDRNQEIADLRAKLMEAEKRIEDLEGDITAAKYGL